MKTRKLASGILSIILFSMVLTFSSFAGEWKQDDNGWRYQNDDNSYKTGWHQDVDGKWYYLDFESGYMLVNSKTPDGFFVDNKGVWMEKQEKEYESYNYDKETKIEITAYENGPRSIKELGYSLPVTVYYNNEYIFKNGEKVNINGIETSKEGVAYLKFVASLNYYSYDMEAKCEYKLSDGTTYESQNGIYIFNNCDEKIETSASIPMTLWKYKQTISSVDIYIDVEN